MVYTEKCRYEIQERKEVPVWYTGIYRPNSSFGCGRTGKLMA
jgi:hypothetical protein